MLTGVNRLKTTVRHGSQVEDAIPPTSTGAVASSQGARGGGLGITPTLGILPGSELVAVPHKPPQSLTLLTSRNTRDFLKQNISLAAC